MSDGEKLDADPEASDVELDVDKAVSKPNVHIQKLTFSDGQEIFLEREDKIVLVGANNSGKSQTIRDITAWIQVGEVGAPLVVKQLELSKPGDGSELSTFLERNAEVRDDAFHLGAWVMPWSHVGVFWSRDGLQSSLWQGYLKVVDAENRLSICQPPHSLSPQDRKSAPQHVLYDDAKLMKRVDGLFHDVFGQHIMLDYRGGNTIPIHVGALPDKSLIDRVGDDYVAAVRANPRLDEQGDGMKSYAGILFESVVADYDMVLIDEPEAFLHPPQMRKLGETLANEVKGQLILATHSSDILRGCLEGTKGKVRVIRIQRDGDGNKVTEATGDVISNLWKEPALRYSNALEGVFHEQTIICEDDSDCRVFNAVEDHLRTTVEGAWKDTAYVPTGGKAGAPRVASVLREIGVPVKAVFDIDLIFDGGHLKKTIEAFGGDWGDIKPLWDQINSAVTQEAKGKNQGQIKDEINESIRQIVDASAPGELKKSDIESALKQTSPWSQVKRHGPGGLPNGQIQTVYVQLDERLENLGIYLVPVGEIENFCRDIGGHGPSFATKLLETYPLGDPKLEELRKFVTRVHLGHSTSSGAAF